LKLVNQDQSSILDIGGIPPFNKPQRRSCVSFNIVFYNYSSVMPENEEEIALISHSHFDRTYFCFFLVVSFLYSLPPYC